jgi:DNA mismatch repair protein MutS
LFATHYFELTTLAAELEACVNVHLDATEHADGIIFLHAVKEGPADRSYGLQVAQLAGVPREVIVRARQYLVGLENQRDRKRPASPQGELPLMPAPDPIASPEDEAARALAAALADINPDDLSPKAALEALYRLRALLK